MSHKARNSKRYSVALLRAALSVMPCVKGLCTCCDHVVLSMLVFPLDGMHNLSAKLLLLLLHRIMIKIEIKKLYCSSAAL